eukprot:366260-Chlamydomonas_euryale.AAC.18
MYTPTRARQQAVHANMGTPTRCTRQHAHANKLYTPTCACMDHRHGSDNYQAPRQAPSHGPEHEKMGPLRQTGGWQGSIQHFAQAPHQAPSAVVVAAQPEHRIKPPQPQQ